MRRERARAGLGFLHVMENLLQFLPERPQPAAIRYGVTAVLVLAFFLFRISAAAAIGQYGFIFFIPPILAASILYDRGSGVVGTVLATVLVGLTLHWQQDAVLHAGALTLFVFVSLFVVVVGEGMRKALEQQVAAQKTADLLLQEQDHRIKNELTIACSLMRLQARTQKVAAVRDALESAAGRLNVLAKSHDHLRIATGDHLIEMQDYLGEMCAQLGDALRGIRPIAISVNADDIVTNSRKATRIGLIVNELVTNALKHAFPGDRAGTISVTLRTNDTGLALAVEDNGIGCPDQPEEGLGSRLTRLLVQELQGVMVRDEVPFGCRIAISIPPA